MPALRTIPPGTRFGRLTVREMERRGKRALYRCHCDCGEETTVRSDTLRAGITRSCGCLNREIAAETLRRTSSNHHRKVLVAAGARFGRLIVLELAGVNRHGSRVYHCACDCGGSSLVVSGHLLSGMTASCGCLQREARITHGWTTHPLYKTWKGMRARCEDPGSISFPSYGGRGIRVDPRWDDFELFVEDVGPKPAPGFTLDRVDSDGPYSPENCRWATPRQQSANTGRPCYTGFTRTIRDQVIERDKVCADCCKWDDRPRYMHVHHVDGDTGNNSLSNLELVCARCHAKRHPETHW